MGGGERREEENFPLIGSFVKFPQLLQVDQAKDGRWKPACFLTRQVEISFSYILRWSVNMAGKVHIPFSVTAFHRMDKYVEEHNCLLDVFDVIGL